MNVGGEAAEHGRGGATVPPVGEDLPGVIRYAYAQGLTLAEIRATLSEEGLRLSLARLRRICDQGDKGGTA